MTDLFQCRVFSREVFMEFKLTGDAAHAALIALPQFVLIAAVASIAAVGLRKLHWDLDVPATSTELQRPPAVSKLTMIACLAVLALAVAAPMVSLLWNGLSAIAWRNLSATVLAEQVTNSLQFGALAATMATIAACALALAAERVLRPWRPLIYVGAAIPFVVPPTLYAIGVSALGNHAWLTNWFPDSGLPVAVANAARWLPFALIMIVSPFRIADRAAEDSARVEGESDLRAPLRITLLPAALSVVGAWLLVFAFTLGDVAMSSLLYPPGGQPIAVAIFDAMHYAHEPEVALLCLLLAGLVVAPALGALAFLRKTIWRPAAVGKA